MVDPQMAQGYRPLFEGSARLGLMLGALELPWDKVTPFVAAFPDEMGAYQELSVHDSQVELGLMTRGAGKDFTFRVTHFMEQHGIDEPRLRRLLVTARHFDHRNVFFKIEVGADGPEEFSWYLRRRPELAVARAWLAETGVSGADLALVDEVARVLGKRTVHFIASSEKADGTSLQKVYFSQPDSTDSFHRLAEAVALCGLGDEDWAPIGGRILDFAGHTAFFSIGFDRGARIPGVKIDLHDLAPAPVAELMTEAGRDEAAIDRARTLMRVMERKRVDYAGFRLTPGEPVRTRIYAYRNTPAAGPGEEGTSDAS